MSEIERDTFKAAFKRLRNFWRYFAVSAVVFLAAHLGGATRAHRLVYGNNWTESWAEGTRFLIEPLGLAYFFAPFLGLALLSSHFQKRARLRGIMIPFGLGLAALSYFFVSQHYWAEIAARDHHWTAASLTIGLVPTLFGAPIFLAVAVLQALAAKFDRAT